MLPAGLFHKMLTHGLCAIRYLPERSAQLFALAVCVGPVQSRQPGFARSARASLPPPALAFGSPKPPFRPIPPYPAVFRGGVNENTLAAVNPRAASARVTMLPCFGTLLRHATPTCPDSGRRPRAAQHSLRLAVRLVLRARAPGTWRPHPRTRLRLELRGRRGSALAPAELGRGTISENKQDRWTRSTPAEVGLPVLLKSPKRRQSPRNIRRGRRSLTESVLPEKAQKYHTFTQPADQLATALRAPGACRHPQAAHKPSGAAPRPAFAPAANRAPPAAGRRPRLSSASLRAPPPPALSPRAAKPTQRRAQLAPGGSPTAHRVSSASAPRRRTRSRPWPQTTWRRLHLGHAPSPANRAAGVPAPAAEAHGTAQLSLRALPPPASRPGPPHLAARLRLAPAEVARDRCRPPRRQRRQATARLSSDSAPRHRPRCRAGPPSQPTGNCASRRPRSPISRVGRAEGSGRLSLRARRSRPPRPRAGSRPKATPRLSSASAPAAAALARTSDMPKSVAAAAAASAGLALRTCAVGTWRGTRLSRL
jgi:hypothetical protein